MFANLANSEDYGQAKTSLSANGALPVGGGLFRMPRPQKNRQFRKLYIGPWLARLGKKPVDAAKAIGVTETYMSELISGKKKNPGHAILFDLSEWLGIPMNALYRMPPAQNAVDAVEGMTAAEMAALGTLLDKVNRGTKKAG